MYLVGWNLISTGGGKTLGPCNYFYGPPFSLKRHLEESNLCFQFCLQPWSPGDSELSSSGERPLW